MSKILMWVSFLLPFLLLFLPKTTQLSILDQILFFSSFYFFVTGIIESQKILKTNYSQNLLIGRAIGVFIFQWGVAYRQIVLKEEFGICIVELLFALGNSYKLFAIWYVRQPKLTRINLIITTHLFLLKLGI